MPSVDLNTQPPTDVVAAYIRIQRVLISLGVQPLGWSEPSVEGPKVTEVRDA